MGADGSPFRGTGRVLQPELLEGASLPLAERSLRDMERINRWFGGHRILRAVVARFVSPPEAFTLLDVGAGSGHVSKALRRTFPRAVVTSMDRRAIHLRPAPPPRVAADAFRPPFGAKSFDFVFCSLFLHHFGDSEIPGLLAGMAALARRAVVVIDLERHPVAYHFLPATRWLFGWSEITLHDGPVSVAAGFQPAELAALAHAAGLRNFVVRRHRPWFRVTLVAPSDAGAPV